MATKRALVVDDEKLIVKGIRFSLEQDDIEVDCAYDGEEALEYARSREYDIIFLDVMLPSTITAMLCISAGSIAMRVLRWSSLSERISEGWSRFSTMN